MELFHGRNVGKIGCSETSKRPELAHFPNDLLEACQLGLSQNEETNSTISAGLLLFQHLSWQVLGLRPITKSRKVWIAIPSIKSNTFKDRPCPNVQQASANQSPFSKGLGFFANQTAVPSNNCHSDPWKTSTENHVPKKCLSKPWIFFEKSFDSAPKMMSQTTESHLKKVSNGLEKNKQWNWKEKPMQIPIISSLKIANWFPGDLKSPEFDLRKRGKQQGCLYSLFSSWTSMYRQPILRKIPPNYVRNVHTALHAWCGSDWCSEHLSSWTWKILTGLFCPVPGMLPHHCLWVWAVSICLVAPW